jgi:hypothetical protein
MGAHFSRRANAFRSPQVAPAHLAHAEHCQAVGACSQYLPGKIRRGQAIVDL